MNFCQEKTCFYLCNDDDPFGSFSVEIISKIDLIKIGTIIFGRESRKTQFREVIEFFLKF